MIFEKVKKTPATTSATHFLKFHARIQQIYWLQGIIRVLIKNNNNKHPNLL